jgi:tRNA wybutosine-synthesizing protein 5
MTLMEAFECVCIVAGDVLFIPALWFHNVVAHDYSVAVNVFWRHLPKEMFEEKDTYGNRDPVPAARAMMSIASALKALKSLPAGW